MCERLILIANWCGWAPCVAPSIGGRSGLCTKVSWAWASQQVSTLCPLMSLKFLSWPPSVMWGKCSKRNHSFVAVLSLFSHYPSPLADSKLLCVHQWPQKDQPWAGGAPQTQEDQPWIGRAPWSIACALGRMQNFSLYFWWRTNGPRGLGNVSKATLLVITLSCVLGHMAQYKWVFVKSPIMVSR